MSWYRTGKASIYKGTREMTGYGTQWADNKHSINRGHIVLLPGSGTVQLYEIETVNSDSSITLTTDYTGETHSQGDYAIINTLTSTVPDFARRLAAQLQYNQELFDSIAEWVKSDDSNVTIILPDGSEVNMPSLQQMKKDIEGASKLNPTIKKIDSSTKNVDWLGAHYMTGTVGAMSGKDERIALDTANGRTQIAVNGGGGGWRYFGLPIEGGALSTQPWVNSMVVNPNPNTVRVIAKYGNSCFQTQTDGNIGFKDLAEDNWLLHHDRTDLHIRGRLKIKSDGDYTGLTLTKGDGNYVDIETSPYAESKSMINFIYRLSNGSNQGVLSFPYATGTVATRQWVQTDAVYKHSLLPFNAPVDVPNNDNSKLARQTYYDYRNLNYDQTRNFQSYPIGVSCGIGTHNKVWGGSNDMVIGMATFRGWTDASGNASNFQLLTQGGHIYWRGGNRYQDTMSNAWVIWSESNTTTDGNGFIKRASPIVEIRANGEFSTNRESKGAKVIRLSEGVYKIINILGFNSDALWGGPDGGIELPTDKNKQPLVWVDYEVEKDGSIIIKTFHRVYKDAPLFAQNNKEGYLDGQPIDIPEGRFISVRVEMPEDSIFHKEEREAESLAAKTLENLDKLEAIKKIDTTINDVYNNGTEEQLKLPFFEEKEV